MQNLCLDTRVVHSLGMHRINHSRLNEGVVPMDISNEAKLIVVGKTKVYIVPPPPMTKEEHERRIEEVKDAGWAIIRRMMEKGSEG